MNWQILGKYLINAGVIIVFLGVFFLMADRFQAGKMPGDFRIGSGENTFIIPIATITLVGITITFIVNYFSR